MDWDAPTEEECIPKRGRAARFAWEVTPGPAARYSGKRQVQVASAWRGCIPNYCVDSQRPISPAQKIRNVSATVNSRPCLGRAKRSRTPYIWFMDGGAASGLPCAGAPPPQRPRPKTCLTHRCAFFAAVRLSGSVPAANQRRFEASLNGASGEGLVKHGTEERADGMKIVLQQSCPFPNPSSLYGWGHKKRITDHS